MRQTDSVAYFGNRLNYCSNTIKNQRVHMVDDCIPDVLSCGGHSSGGVQCSSSLFFSCKLL